jgi:hypothetical protein
MNPVFCFSNSYAAWLAILLILKLLDASFFDTDQERRAPRRNSQ